MSLSSRPLKIAIVSTPVGALGSGIGGGVEFTIRNLALGLIERGHRVQIIAPLGSVMGDLPITPIAGALQTTAQTQAYTAPITMPPDAVLGNMWAYLHQTQGEWDLIFNTAFDWLGFYLVPFFQIPIAHFVSMGSQIEAIDLAIAKVAKDYPGTIGVCSLAQAQTFSFADACTVIRGGGIDPSLYDYCDTPAPCLAWVGRISPEKALEDAIEAAQQTGLKLKIMGKIQDPAYWQKLQSTYADAAIDYRGFLSTEQLQQELRTCRGMLMTPRWVEAFGNVAIEALACGVPVISYRRGGPAEIVDDGKTGFLVEPDSVSGLVGAIERLDTIDRATCRQTAETIFSQSAWVDLIETWFHQIVKRSPHNKPNEDFA
jgi:UDP-glucose:tetrahydrobiopterin glucosyltransferase